MTQPTLSDQVRRVEIEIGVKLLYKLKRKAKNLPLQTRHFQLRRKKTHLQRVILEFTDSFPLQMVIRSFVFAELGRSLAWNGTFYVNSNEPRLARTSNRPR